MDGPTSPQEWSDDVVTARPYLLTQGRTRAANTSLSMESVVVLASAATAIDLPSSAFERGRILARCRRPQSVAELAARLHLPLTVALVLVGDLVAEGLLLASTATPQDGDDIPFLERLIAGVAAL